MSSRDVARDLGRPAVDRVRVEPPAVVRDEGAPDLHNDAGHGPFLGRKGFEPVHGRSAEFPAPFPRERLHQENALTELGDERRAKRRLLVPGHEIHLVENEPPFAARELGAVAPQLALHHPGGGEGRFRPDGGVHDVQEQAGALEVAKERETEPRSLRRALDDARNVGEHEAAQRVHEDHPELRIQCGERVVGHSRPRRGHGAKEGRFSGVGLTQEPHVGEQPELQAQAPGPLPRSPGSSGGVPGWCST